MFLLTNSMFDSISHGSMHAITGAQHAYKVVLMFAKSLLYSFLDAYWLFILLYASIDIFSRLNRHYICAP